MGDRPSLLTKVFSGGAEAFSLRHAIRACIQPCWRGVRQNGGTTPAGKAGITGMQPCGIRLSNSGAAAWPGTRGLGPGSGSLASGLTRDPRWANRPVGHWSPSLRFCWLTAARPRAARHGLAAIRASKYIVDLVARLRGVQGATIGSCVEPCAPATTSFPALASAKPRAALPFSRVQVVEG